VLVIDASVTADEEDVAFWDDACGRDTLVVLNKTDLAMKLPLPLRDSLADRCAALVETSARTGGGCAALATALVAAARERIGAEQVGISRVRHRAAIERALAPLRRAADLAKAEGACELAALEIRAALDELAAISVALDNDEVLDAIFSEFCIGK
jgi:tRNA modification GTPase